MFGEQTGVMSSGTAGKTVAKMCHLSVVTMWPLQLFFGCIACPTLEVFQTLRNSTLIRAQYCMFHISNSVLNKPFLLPVAPTVSQFL